MGNKSYSKGISWFDDCRIPTSLDDIEISKNKRNKSSLGTIQNKWETESLKAIESTFDLTKGRFPANLLVCDDMLNDGNIVKSSNNWSKKTNLQSPYFTDERQEIQKDTSYGDKGTNSRYYNIDKWFENLIDE